MKRRPSAALVILACMVESAKTSAQVSTVLALMVSPVWDVSTNTTRASQTLVKTEQRARIIRLDSSVCVHQGSPANTARKISLIVKRIRVRQALPVLI